MSDLDRLLEEVLRSRNYRSVSEDLVRDIGRGAAGGHLL